ncbi:MAG: Mur ligase domain-containing protein [Victivallaceae bacterium]|nr:Mur ligase domain-containing protein [Victivallaceae bacterium]
MLPRNIHLIGAGGAGIQPLASLLQARNCRITASDLAANYRTAALEAAGIPVAIGHRAENLPANCDCVVFTSAATADNPELVEAARRNIPCRKRGAFLAEVAATYRQVVSITGSHGKTSVTAMLSWLFPEAGRMIGGSVRNFSDWSAGDGSLFLTEADESDGSNTFLHGTLGIITNTDDDHAWSLGGEEVLRRNYHAFAWNHKTLLLVEKKFDPTLFETHADLRLVTADEIDEVEQSGIFHGYQAEDAAIALAAARILGRSDVTPDDLKDFPGVERRMSVRYAGERITLIEDYAHHPAELRASIELLRRKYPREKYHLRIVFQPHRAARLERYFDRFVALLRSADSAAVAPLFAAWCENAQRSHQELADASGAIALTGCWEEDANNVLGTLPSGDTRKLVIAVIGAGDIEKILPPLLTKVAKQ